VICANSIIGVIMKIGILSLIGREFNDNYGGVLQNFALNSLKRHNNY
jgi:hypothetical protein